MFFHIVVSILPSQGLNWLSDLRSPCHRRTVIQSCIGIMKKSCTTALLATTELTQQRK